MLTRFLSFAVNHLISTSDFKALQPMVSKKLLDAVEATSKQYVENGLTFTNEVEGEKYAATLSDMDLIDAAEMKR